MGTEKGIEAAFENEAAFSRGRRLFRLHDSVLADVATILQHLLANCCLEINHPIIHLTSYQPTFFFPLKVKIAVKEEDFRTSETSRRTYPPN